MGGPDGHASGANRIGARREVPGHVRGASLTSGSFGSYGAVGASGGDGGGHGGHGGHSVNVPPPNPVMDQALALRQFGGDLTFLKQMCLKFISSGRGLVERIQSLVDGLTASPPATSPCHVDIRRDAHSLKGAASTIGAMRLSQTALDLQLAAESEADSAALAEIAAQVSLQFQAVVAALDPETGDLVVAQRKPNTRPGVAPPGPPPPAPGLQQAAAEKSSLAQTRLPRARPGRIPRN